MAKIEKSREILGKRTAYPLSMFYYDLYGQSKEAPRQPTHARKMECFTCIRAGSLDCCYVFRPKVDVDKVARTQAR